VPRRVRAGYDFEYARAKRAWSPEEMTVRVAMTRLAGAEPAFTCDYWNRDGDAVAANYAEDAVIINSQSVTIGRDNIRVSIMRVFSKPLTPRQLHRVPSAVHRPNDLA